MLAESSCTLYIFNGISFDRHFIPKCHWQENRAANVLKSGMQSADSVTVYLPKDSTTPKNLSRDMIIKGECNFEFDSSSEKSASECMQKFIKLYPEFLTVSSVDQKLYGSERLQHIKVSAR